MRRLPLGSLLEGPFSMRASLLLTFRRSPICRSRLWSLRAPKTRTRSVLSRGPGMIPRRPRLSHFLKSPKTCALSSRSKLGPGAGEGAKERESKRLEEGQQEICTQVLRDVPGPTARKGDCDPRRYPDKG